MNEVSINKSMKLSEHFSLAELCKTSYHTSDGNIPSHVAIENLKNICANWLEDLRYSYNLLYGDNSSPELGEDRRGLRSSSARLLPEGRKNTSISPHVQTTPAPPNLGGEEDTDIPIIISSGYRSEEVNMKCGGAKGSNHLTGCAVDIRCYGPEQMIRMAGILLDIADGTKQDFDELIQEKRGSTYWVHFAVRPKDNRRKILFDCR